LGTKQRQVPLKATDHGVLIPGRTKKKATHFYKEAAQRFSHLTLGKEKHYGKRNTIQCYGNVRTKGGQVLEEASKKPNGDPGVTDSNNWRGAPTPGGHPEGTRKRDLDPWVRNITQPGRKETTFYKTLEGGKEEEEEPWGQRGVLSKQTWEKGKVGGKRGPPETSGH